MTAKELINELEKFNPDALIKIPDNKNMDWMDIDQVLDRYPSQKFDYDGCVYIIEW